MVTKKVRKIKNSVIAGVLILWMSIIFYVALDSLYSVGYYGLLISICVVVFVLYICSLFVLHRKLKNDLRFVYTFVSGSGKKK